MSKHKNKKNQTATPKEPITRRDLCARICVLQQEINTLRRTNTNLAGWADFHKNTSQKALKRSDDLLSGLEQMRKRARHYRTMAILALILSGLSHLIYLFI